MASAGGDKSRYERFPLGVAAAGILCSLIAAGLVYHVTETEAERRWRVIANDQITLLECRIDRAIGWLEATRGLFRASTYVTRAEFNEFATWSRKTTVDWPQVDLCATGHQCGVG